MPDRSSEVLLALQSKPHKKLVDTLLLADGISLRSFLQRQQNPQALKAPRMHRSILRSHRTHIPNTMSAGSAEPCAHQAHSRQPARDEANPVPGSGPRASRGLVKEAGRGDALRLGPPAAHFSHKPCCGNAAQPGRLEEGRRDRGGGAGNTPRCSTPPALHGQQECHRPRRLHGGGSSRREAFLETRNHGPMNGSHPGTAGPTH